MLKKYKNTLPEFFESLDLNGDKIDLKDSLGQTTISYDSSMKFVITQHKNNFHLFTFSKTFFQPDFPLTQYKTKYIRFEELKAELSHWIKNDLKEYIFEHEGPDNLEDWIRESNKFIDIENIDFESNEPFIKSEIKTIKEGLEEAKNLIIERFNLNDQKSKLLQERVDYLIESTKRVSRKTDWKNILIATVLNLTITLALDPEKAKELWQMFSKIFTIILQIGENIPHIKPSL